MGLSLANSGYLFLELSVVAYMVGFGWELWNFKQLLSIPAIAAIAGLAFIWFMLDQIAVHLGLWTFPQGGTLPLRFFSLPIEEYVLFVLHSLVCFLFVQQYARGRR